MIPQIIFICLQLFGLKIILTEYRKTGNGRELSTSLIAIVINHTLLIWGGFYNCLFN